MRTCALQLSALKVLALTGLFFSSLNSLLFKVEHRTEISSKWLKDADLLIFSKENWSSPIVGPLSRSGQTEQCEQGVTPVACVGTLCALTT